MGTHGWVLCQYFVKEDRVCGDIRKVAACKVRPYELVDTGNLPESQDSLKKKVVMLEDGLSDNVTQDDETIQYAVDMVDKEKDCIGAKYLKVINHMSFLDYSIYTVELPVSKHGTPEVKQAKQTEIKI